MPSTPPSSPRILSRACLLALGLLVGAEIVVRLFFASSVTGRFEYGYAPTSGFVESGDGSIRLERSGGRRFHPQRFPRERPDGTPRLMVVGDSVPRGPSLEASYARQLATLCSGPGRPAEGWNLAVAGYGARRVQIVLRQALTYRPTVVVLHVNNSNEYEDEREYRRSREFQGWHPRNWMMKSFVFRRLHEMKTEKVYWELLPEAVRARQGVNDADAETAASMNPETLREWDERVRRETAESLRLCREAGVPVLLVTQARRERRPDGSLFLDDGGLDAMVAPWVGPGVAHLSMKEVFQGADLATAFADSAHLKAPAHRLLAEAIRRRLEERGFLGSR